MTSRRPLHWGCFLITLLLPMGYFAIAQSSHFGWGDEVQFIDPAARFHFGQGFTSTAWPYQNASEFFAGNAPGYSFLLIPWFTLFGFGLDQARWMNVPLGMVSMALCWTGLSRLSPRMPAWLKAVSLLAAFFGAGVLLNFSSARYDVLDMLVASAAFVLLSRADAPQRSKTLSFMLVGMAAFYAGFHLVVWLLACMAVLWMLDAPSHRRAALATGAGVLAGLGSWLMVLATKGLAVKFFLMTLGSQHTLSGQMAKMAKGGGAGLRAKLDAYLSLPSLDASFTLVALFVLLLLIISRMTRRPDPTTQDIAKPRSIGRLAVALVFGVPLLLMTVGKFPIYYVWMSSIPAMLISAAWTQRLHEHGLRWPRVAHAGVATMAMVLGVHAHVTTQDTPWQAKTYIDFQHWIRAELRSTDVVYADHEAYFAARSIAAGVLAPTYAQTALVPGIPQRDGVSVLLVKSAAQDSAMALMGGRWQAVARFRDPPRGPADAIPHRLDFVVLRRQP